MGNRKDKEKITLEALLELKRHERPSNDFWDSFESDFQRRRLQSLCIRQPLGGHIWSPVAKTLVFGVPALALMALSLFWSRANTLPETSLPLAAELPMLQVQDTANTSLSQGRPAEMLQLPSTNLASSQFVVDAIHDDSGSAMNFRKVLYTPAIHLSVPSGAFYVRDNFSSSNYEITTADLKLGRNF